MIYESQYYGTLCIDGYDIEHHGIKGMKWGVRRFQNSDGTYTAEGLKRFRSAEKDYDAAAASYKKAKKQYKKSKSAKDAYKMENARLEMNRQKTRLSKHYDQLKMDNRADKGKRRAAKGETIFDNKRKVHIADMLTPIGAGVLATALTNKKIGLGKGKSISFNRDQALLDASLLAGGALASYALKKHHNNKQLRAYYNHSRPKF